jgi:hypothetical protein
MTSALQPVVVSALPINFHPADGFYSKGVSEVSSLAMLVKLYSLLWGCCECRAASAYNTPKAAKQTTTKKSRVVSAGLRYRAQTSVSKQNAKPAAMAKAPHRPTSAKILADNGKKRYLKKGSARFATKSIGLTSDQRHTMTINPVKATRHRAMKGLLRRSPRPPRPPENPALKHSHTRIQMTALAW